VFPVGTDPDLVDSITYNLHFSIDNVECVGYVECDFIKLEINPIGDDYLVIDTDDNAHAFDTNYPRDYVIKYWLSDISLCESTPTSQISEVK